MDKPDNAWDRTKKSGHDFTLIAQAVGTSTYWCELCGSIMMVRDSSELILFHSPTNNLAAPGLCPEKGTASLGHLNPTPLRDKILVMAKEDLKKLGDNNDCRVSLLQ